MLLSIALSLLSSVYKEKPVITGRKISFSQSRPSARLNSPQTLLCARHTAGFTLQNKRYFFRVFYSREGKRKAGVERETRAVWEGVTCEQKTYYRSSLLSLRKIASTNPSGKTIPWRKTFCFDDGQSDQRRERRDDRRNARYASRNVLSGEKRGETAVFAG